MVKCHPDDHAATTDRMAIKSSCNTLIYKAQLQEIRNLV